MLNSSNVRSGSSFPVHDEYQIRPELGVKRTFRQNVRTWGYSGRAAEAALTVNPSQDRTSAVLLINEVPHNELCIFAYAIEQPGALRLHPVQAAEIEPR